MAASSRSRRDERGAAVTDFVLVSALLVLVFVVVLQVGLALWTRNTLVAAAQEGARVAARVDATPAMGIARTRELILAQLSPRYAADVTIGEASAGGARVAVVTIQAPVPVLGPLGPDRGITARGRAYLEAQ